MLVLALLLAQGVALFGRVSLMTKRHISTRTESAPRKEASASPPTKPLHHPALICVILAAVTALAYHLVAGHGFVDYDDGDYVSANPHVESGLRWANVVWAFTTGHASNWHPLTWLSHMLDYQFFGRSPGAQHLVNLALHIANTLLLFLVLRRMTASHWGSVTVAALFALHPLHVESVAWLSERKDVLSTLFLMLTLYAYARYAELQAVGRERAERSGGGVSASTPTLPGSPALPVWYFASLVFFALGLMSKPMLVTVPFLLLLLDFWPLHRMQLPQAPVWRIGNLPRLIVEKLPFLALTVASSLVTFLVQQKGGAVSSALSFGQRVANALVSYVRYLWKMLWPEDLAVLYPHPGNWPLWQIVLCALLLAGIFVLAIRLARTRPYIPVGWLWFFGGLIPVIGLVQVGIQSMADRYTYVPLIGVFIAIVWGIQDLAVRFSWRRELLAFGTVVLLSACALLTIRQTAYWRNTEALFQRAVEVEPRNYLAYNNLGYYYANHGKPDLALENYRKSIEINPQYEDALNNLGHALAQQQRHAEAIPYYEAALRVRPRHAEVHNNFGNALSELGRIDEAIAHYRITLEQKPEHADAHNNLGIALAMKGRLDEAVPHFRDALRFKPNYASAHSNLGNALAVQQKWDEAIKEYRECLRLNPEDPQAHNNLGNVLAQLGRLDEAVREYNEAIRLKPNNPEAHFNLGVTLIRQGKPREARAHFAEALRLKPSYVEAQRQLAAMDSSSK